MPTAHRLVAQLEKRGLLKRALGSKKVVIGEALVRLGVSAVEAALRGDRPHRILLALSASLGEHVQVGIRSDNDVLYVDTARVPLSGPGLMFEQGRRAPLYCTSIGKIFLAEMADEEFSQWLAQMPLPAVTPHTITKRPQLRAAAARSGRRAGPRPTRNSPSAWWAAPFPSVTVTGSLLPASAFRCRAQECPGRISRSIGRRWKQRRERSQQR